MYTVLIVEDDVDENTIISSLLRFMGYKVVSVHSKKEALEILSSDVRVDVLYTDLKLSDGLGSEILAEMGKRSPRIATILISGWYLMPSARYAGFDDYLVKPTTVEQVRDTIKSCLLLREDEEKAA